MSCIPGAVANCFDTSSPCDALCDDSKTCVTNLCNTCLERIQLDGSVFRLCFTVGFMGLCRGRPDPMDWHMDLCKKGTDTVSVSYQGFEFDLYGNICFVLDAEILNLDQSKRYVAKIMKCGEECGRVEVYFARCFAELFSITLGNNIECVDTNPAPTCEQLGVVSECGDATTPTNIPCA